MANDTHAPICMAEEFWMNSHFSVARFYGGMRLNGHDYTILGTDLVRTDFRQLYIKLGRERFINILEQNKHEDDNRIKTIMQVALRAGEEPVRPREESVRPKAVQMELFND